LKSFIGKFVIPAKAGIQSSQSASDRKAWIPAFAGMTENPLYGFIALHPIALIKMAVIRAGYPLLVMRAIRAP
jgi:hypothetical protein